MARGISPSEAVVLERLELERPSLVTTDGLAGLLREAGIGTLPRVFAARLRRKGWLLATPQPGVWEFAPAAVAGPYSSADPLLGFRSFLARHPGAACGLTFQAAAWAHGLADRAPARPEVAAVDAGTARRLPSVLNGSVFVPVLGYVQARDVPALRPESVIVHMCAKPMSVRSWASTLEWLPDLAAETSGDDILLEVASRPASVWARAGYLLQGLRPDIAARIAEGRALPARTWFGSRNPVLRHDASWQVADALLPFDPRTLEAVS